MNNKQSEKIHGMIDVSAKPVTRRVAKAAARIVLGKKAFSALMRGESPKGDVFETARIAGIMAAKSTPAIIPMCHPLEINQVKVAFTADATAAAVDIVAEVVCRGRTGVEMEALTAACAAALTIYDMMKWADHLMAISDVKLLYKSGGKRGTFERRG